MSRLINNIVLKDDIVGLGLLLREYEDLGPELHCFLKVKEDPYFTKDYFGPESTRSIILVDRPHIC